MTISNVKIFIFFVSIFYFLLSTFYFADAQTSPQFLISWQAQSYAPSWYQGKILPVYGAPLEISFELIDNGKSADLSKTKVRWYVNDKLVKNENDGLGIKFLKITAPDYGGHESTVRITVIDYRGGGLLDKMISIPAVSPEAVIEAPYPDRKISTGVSSFQAVPFFFNVKNLNNLSVEWSANDQKSEGSFDNPWLLNLNLEPRMPSATEIRLSVLVKNLLNELQFAGKNINLVIK